MVADISTASLFQIFFHFLQAYLLKYMHTFSINSNVCVLTQINWEMIVDETVAWKARFLFQRVKSFW